MKKKGLFVLLGSLCVALVLTVLPFTTGCVPEAPPEVTPPPVTPPVTPPPVTPPPEAPPEAPPEKVYKIGLTQFATHPAADAGRQGFIDALADAGFVDAITTSPDLETVFYTQGGGVSVTLKKRGLE